MKNYYTIKYSKESHCLCNKSNVCRCKRRRSPAKRGVCKVCLSSFEVKSNKETCSEECESQVVRFKCTSCYKEVVRPKVYGTSKYCSVGCSLKGVPSKTIDRQEIYSLFEYTCLVCNTKIDMEAPARSNMSPTLDHVVPRALGGQGDWFNLAPAHAICNHKKSDKLDHAMIERLQERLYGASRVRIGRLVSGWTAG